MAFSIIIKTDNDDLFKLVKSRLSSKFPDAYIIPDNAQNIEEATSMSEFTTRIYDNLRYDDSNGDIPLYTADSNGNLIIDCSVLTKSIKNLKGDSTSSITIDKPASRMHILISYAYIDERESNISTLFNHLKFEADYPIRIDLMSGIRMATSVKTGLHSGSLSALLRDVNTSKFKPKRILEYLNPEIGGFLTPGHPDNSDDVFEIGIPACKKLLSNLRKLTYSDEIDVNALVVVEGFRINEIKSLLPYFDDIHFLIPSRMCDESIGLQETINGFSQDLSDKQNLLIHYFEKTNSELLDETIRA